MAMEFSVIFETVNGKKDEVEFNNYNDAKSTFYFYGDNKKAFGLKLVALLEIYHGEYEDHFEYTEAI